MALAFYEATNEVLQNPAQHVQRATGRWALRFLLLSLSITPLRQILVWPWLHRFRRSFGLLAFTYLCFHLLTYLSFDFGFDFTEIIRDANSKRFVWVGLLAYGLLIPLALTSTRRAQIAMGARWKKLHRLVYPAAILAVIHYYMLTKVDLSLPLAYSAILASLFLLRVWRFRRTRTQ